jgi:hypothetical protein
MFQTKIVDKIKTQICVQKLFSENRAGFQITWKNMAHPERPQMIIEYVTCALHTRYLRLHTHTKYVILIAVPWQQWLREWVSVLRCTYIACVVTLC